MPAIIHTGDNHTSYPLFIFFKMLASGIPLLMITIKIRVIKLHIWIQHLRNSFSWAHYTSYWE